MDFVLIEVTILYSCLCYYGLWLFAIIQWNLVLLSFSYNKMMFISGVYVHLLSGTHLVNHPVV